MAVHLITGKGSKPHVTSQDIAQFNACTYSPLSRVLSGCKVEVINSNTVRITEGNLLFQGRHIRITGSEDVHINNGSYSGRLDLIGIRYNRSSSDQVETVSLEVKQGASGVLDFDRSNIVLNRNAETDWHPFWSVRVSNNSISEPKQIIPSLPTLDNLSQRDYVLSEGDSGGWHYRKWNNGWAEMVKAIKVNRTSRVQDWNTTQFIDTGVHTYPFELIGNIFSIATYSIGGHVGSASFDFVYSDRCHPFVWVPSRYASNRPDSWLILKIEGKWK